MIGVELVLQERAGAVEQRLGIGHAVAQRLHQPRGARERVLELPFDFRGGHLRAAVRLPRAEAPEPGRRLGQRLLDRQVQQLARGLA